VSGRDNLPTRFLRASLGFGYYGIGALVLSAVAPLLRWLRGSEAPVQTLVHWGHRSFIWLLTRVGEIRLQTTGTERLLSPGPHLVVANHPTLIDAMILNTFMPRVDFIVSRTYTASPFLRGVIWAADYIADEGGVGVVEEVVKRLRAGRSVLIFPEGTRSPQHELGRFQRGAAHAALRSGCDILPVVITVEPRILMKGQKWHDRLKETAEFRVRVLEPLAPSKLLAGGESEAIAARLVTAALLELYEGVYRRDE